MDRRTDTPGELVDFDTLRPGEELPPVEFEMSAAAARAYLLATGSATSAGPEIAPPLALVALALAAMTDRMPLPPSTQHVGQEVWFAAAVPIGATVRARFTLEARRVAGRLTVSVFRFELDEERSLCARGTIMLRHVAAEHARFA